MFYFIIHQEFIFGKNEGVKGAPGGIRTHNQQLRRLVLCPLSYGGLHAGEGQNTFTDLFVQRPKIIPNFDRTTC